MKKDEFHLLLAIFAALVSLLTPAQARAAPALFTQVATSNLSPSFLNSASFHTSTTGSNSSYLDAQAYGSINGPIFHATGTASATFGSLGCSTQVLLREYTAAEYSGNIFMSSAAQFTDTLTIPGASSIKLTFNLSGGVRDSDGSLIKSFISFSGNAASGGININSGALGFYPQGDFTTPLISLTPGQPFNMLIQLQTQVLTNGAGPSGAVTAGIFYSDTARLTLVQAFDSFGTPLPNFTVSAASGTSYPTKLAPLSAAKTVEAAGVFTLIPGGTGNFTSLPGAPGYSSSGQVAFYGTGSADQQGIYRVNNGTPIKVADLNTAIPGGTGDFTSFIPQEPFAPAIDGSNVAFFGAGNGGQQGIYVAMPQEPIIPVEPARIADKATPIPSGTGNFTSFIPQGLIAPNPAISGSKVAFYGAGSGGQQGVYVVDHSVQGPPMKIADTSTAIPGGVGMFTAIPVEPTISGNNVAFLGSGSGGQQGVYRAAIGASLIRVADTNTAIPGGTGNFTSFIPQEPTAPAIDGTSVAFFGAGSGGQQGLYIGSDVGPPIKVADMTTAIPGGTGNFTSFGNVSVSATDVAFLGFGSGGQQGIYDMTGGSLVKVVGINDIIGGRSISALRFSSTGLFGDPIAFQATFADGSQGIFTNAVRPPGDWNLDGHVTSADIQSLLTALTDLKQFQTAHSLSDTALLALGDANGDGAVNNLDVQGLIDLLKNGGGSLSAVPEPSAVGIAASGCLVPGVFAIRRKIEIRRAVPAIACPEPFGNS